MATDERPGLVGANDRPYTIIIFSKFINIFSTNIARIKQIRLLQI